MKHIPLDQKKLQAVLNDINETSKIVKNNLGEYNRSKKLLDDFFKNIITIKGQFVSISTKMGKDPINKYNKIVDAYNTLLQIINEK